MGDANSAYKLSDVPLFQELDRFNLMMLEQPLAHDDIFDHAKLQRQIQTPICLDESIRSAEDATNAISLESCKIINVKLGRVGGHAEAKRVEQVARERDSRLVWRHARVGNRPRAQHRDVDACRFHFARRRVGQRALLGRGHHRPAGESARAARSQRPTRLALDSTLTCRVSRR